MKKKESKKNKKIIIIVLLIIVVIAFFIVLFKTVLVPLNNYKKANQYLENKEYDKAIELYKKNEKYKDSKENIKKAYYEQGLSLIENEKYDEAIKVLKNASGDELENYLLYANAMIDFKGGKYNLALTKFEKLKDFKRSNDSANYCNLMLAEQKYKEGKLVEAKTMFSELDKDLEYNNVKVSSRLEILEKYKAFVNLCGTWTGTNGKMSVRQTHDSTGLWDQWDGTYQSALKLNCIINEDGTVTLKGSASYYAYTNYSSLSKYLKTPEKSLTIDKTVSSMPKNLASSGNASLTYSGGKFSLSYDYKDSNSSMNFTYRYKSSITYSKREAK